MNQVKRHALAIITGFIAFAATAFFIGAYSVFIALITWYGWLYITAYRPPRMNNWHFENIKEPLNALMISGVVAVHLFVQIFLSAIGIDDFTFHAIIFFSIAPAHIVSVCIGVFEKPPKPPGSKLYRPKGASRKGWFS